MNIDKIPQTTEKEPFIEFSYHEKGKLKFQKTSDWWGGAQATFVTNDNFSGNSCLPKDLDEYINIFFKKRINEVKEEIRLLHKRLKLLKQHKQEFNNREKEIR